MAADPSSPNPADPVPDGASSGRGGRLMLWGVAIFFLAAGLFGGHQGAPLAAPHPSRASGASAATPADPPADPLAEPPADPPAGPRESADALPRSAPTRLIIPKIGVNAPFTDLAIGPTGQLQPPPAADTNLVGWYAKGPSPGEKGTAIIAGHVDTVLSAAVFVYLDRLVRGDMFSVERADGRTADFVVDSAETFAKDHFPDNLVYADAPRPEVRLITCAGGYDHAVKDYKDNLVVFAHLV